MTDVRAAAAAALVLASIVALPARAAGPRPVVLSDTVTVVTSRSGTLEVSLPDDARLSVSAGADDVTFDGAGRMVGLWLERSDHSGDFLTSYRLPAFAGGRQVTYGSMPAADCTGVPSDALPLTYDCTGSTAPQPVLLHEGRYRLTVLADGSPLRVTLRLHGLDGGALSLAPQRDLPSAERALPVLDTVGTDLVTFGAEAALGVPVQAIVVATAKTSAGSAFDESSVCVRPGGSAPPLAYGPHCPDGTSGGYQYRLSVGGTGTQGMGGFVSSYSEDETGPVGAGGSFGDSDGVTFGQALGVWLARS